MQVAAAISVSGTSLPSLNYTLAVAISVSGTSLPSQNYTLAVAISVSGTSLPSLNYTRAVAAGCYVHLVRSFEAFGAAGTNGI